MERRNCRVADQDNIPYLRRVGASVARQWPLKLLLTIILMVMMMMTIYLLVCQVLSGSYDNTSRAYYILSAKLSWPTLGTLMLL